MTELSKFYERLGKLVPGYSGYSNRNDIREDDYQLRLYAKQKIEGFVHQIEKSKNDFDDDAILEIDKVQNNLRLFCVKVVNQSYGYSALFDKSNSKNDMREKKLNLLVENDKEIISIIEGFSVENHDIDALKKLEENLVGLLAHRKEIVR